MDEIFQLIIFVAAMGISLFVQQKTKAKKQPATSSPKKVLEDLFPELDQPQETEFVQPLSSISEPSEIRKPPIFREKRNTIKQNEPIIPQKPTKSEKRIKLNTKEEVRKAFIHSEIFKRKY